MSLVSSVRVAAPFSTRSLSNSTARTERNCRRMGDYFFTREHANRTFECRYTTVGGGLFKDWMCRVCGYHKVDELERGDSSKPHTKEQGHGIRPVQWNFDPPHSSTNQEIPSPTNVPGSLESLDRLAKHA